MVLVTLVPSVYSSVTSVRNPSEDILVVRDLIILLLKEASDFKLAPCDSDELVCDLAVPPLLGGRECAPLPTEEVVDWFSNEEPFLLFSRDDR
jgi:hypothetical protein